MPIAPHFAMELHLHLAAAQPRETWVEHFAWLEPPFNERLELRDGRMLVPPRPDLGLTLSEARSQPSGRQADRCREGATRWSPAATPARPA